MEITIVKTQVLTVDADDVLEVLKDAEDGKINFDDCEEEVAAYEGNPFNYESVDVSEVDAISVPAHIASDIRTALGEEPTLPAITR